ncbi:MAG TPA: NAD(P)H-dependent glycerol-3-phosphate dehydrogenase [Rhizomicrobium sp.]|jgi:glycerol-3-phosphate dehydrogenase (NAD(P)+)
MTKNNESPEPYHHIGILGGGAWGTALAIVAAEAGRSVILWTRDPDLAGAMARKRENARFLPGVELPSRIAATVERKEAEEADAILAVVPAQATRELLAGARVRPGTPLVLCMKGMEHGSGKLMTEVLAETVPAAEPAILSGPSFARDVARNLPTAVTIAARTPIAQRLQASLGHMAFRPYASEDLIGVALGGAAKNVYAIGCGIVRGLGLGESARAALLSRCFAELRRFGRALGGRAETLMGLSGLGDLVLTATSPTSRNYSFGLALGRGSALAELRAPGADLAEGVETAPALVERARHLAIELPIAHVLADILDGAIAPAEALPRLMARPFKME